MPNSGSIEKHCLLADSLETHAQLSKSLIELLFGNNFFKQCSQSRNIPLAVTKVIDLPTFRVLGGNVKRLIERFVRAPYPQTGFQHQKRFPHRGQNILSRAKGFCN